MFRKRNKAMPAMILAALAAALIALALSVSESNTAVTALLAVLAALLAAVLYMFFRISSAVPDDLSRRADAFLMPLDDADEEIVGKRPDNQ